ncbi:MAG: FitA-like ribbon-helix-helix domain-containing protein [Myxococcota bacterium]
MANLQVKNVPPELYERLRTEAEQEGRPMRDLVLEALDRELGRRAMLARLAGRQPVDLGRPAARALEEARAERERDAG